MALDKLWAALWPPVLGTLLAVMIWYAFWRRGEKPAGVPARASPQQFEAGLWYAFWRRGEKPAGVPARASLQQFEAGLWRAGGSLATLMTTAEQRLRDWPVAGVLFLLLLALFFAMVSL